MANHGTIIIYFIRDIIFHRQENTLDAFLFEISVSCSRSVVARSHRYVTTELYATWSANA